jgi:hypothetical protein
MRIFLYVGICFLVQSCSTTSSSPSATTTTTTGAPYSGSTMNPGGAANDDDGTTTTSIPPTQSPDDVADWVVPESLRESLRARLNAAVTIQSMSEAQLSTADPVPYSDVFTPLNPAARFVSEGSFIEIQDGSVTQVWTSLTKYAPDTLQCLDAFNKYWVRRPEWFMASLNDIRLLRQCLTIARSMMANLNPKSVTDVQSGLVVASAVNDWLVVAYSAKAELALRRDKSVTTGVADLETRVSQLPLFSSYINSKPNLKDRLMAVSDGDNNLDIDPAHVADFVDYEWSEAALGRNGQSVLHYWKALFANYDERVVFDSEAKNVFVNENIDTALSFRMTHYRFGMGAARGAWLGTVGYLLGVLYASSPEGVRRCLPTDFNDSDFAQLFYFLDDNIHTLIPMYRCITDGIDSGDITLAVDDYESLGTVMHMVRMTTSAIAFALSV